MMSEMTKTPIRDSYVRLVRIVSIGDVSDLTLTVSVNPITGKLPEWPVKGELDELQVLLDEIKRHGETRMGQSQWYTLNWLTGYSGRLIQP